MVNTTSDAGRNVVRLTLSVALGTFAMAATPALGAAQAQSQRPVTFAKDVAPILQRTCQNCHRPGLGGGAPMSLVTYEDVRPWARAIKLKTTQREMPPWFIEKNVGVQQFKEDISLSDEEIDTIARWVDGGAPLGNPADLPPARKFAATQEWTIGTPDLVVTSPEMEVKAVAADWHGFLTPTSVGLTKTRFIKAVEVREVRVREEEVVEKPGQPRAALGYSVLHHAGITTGSGRIDEKSNSELVGMSASAFGITHEAGQNATIYPDELGIELPAGSTLQWRVHSHSFGRQVVIKLEVAFKFQPEGFTPKYTLKGSAIGGELANHDLDIPAGERDVRFDSLAVLSKPAKLVTFEPHMHAGGKRMCLLATLPTGIRQTINCAAYNHNWVKIYTYADDAAPLLPAGTILQVVGWYDNSEKNPRVSEPRNWKGFGSRSIDDMMFFLGRFAPLTDEQFKEEVAARQAKQTRSTQNNNN